MVRHLDSDAWGQRGWYLKQWIQIWPWSGDLHDNFQLILLIRNKGGSGKTPSPSPGRYAILHGASMLKFQNQYNLSMYQRAKTTEAPPPGPTGESTIDFAGHIIFISESEPEIIDISFEDQEGKMKHEVKKHPLNKINYQTVLAAFKMTHPHMISATLDMNADEIYELEIKVAHEYLPVVFEKMVFEKRELVFEEQKEAVMKKMRRRLKVLTEKLNTVGSLQIVSGKLEENIDTQIFQSLNHRRTVYTWSLTIRKASSNLLRAQMYYYNSITKVKKSSEAIPDRGIYFYTNGESGYIELRFLAEREDFDAVIFVLEGRNRGEYTIKNEKVESAK